MSDINDSAIVRKLIIGTITNSGFLKGLREIWKPDLVGHGWLWVADQAFLFYDQYGRAPNKEIEFLWQKAEVDPDTRTDLEGLLSGLSKEYEKEQDQASTEMLLDEAERYFAREQYLRTALEVEQLSEVGKLDDAYKLIREVPPPKIERVESLNFFSPESDELVKGAFQQQKEPLFTLGGDLGKELDDQFVPDSFIGYLGEEKAGKTYWLQAHLFAAIKSRRNVYYAACGDLSLSQQVIRFGIQLTGRNLKTRYNTGLVAPILDCYHNQDGSCDDAPTNSLVILGKGKPYPNYVQFQEVEGDYEACTNTSCPNFLPMSWWARVQDCPDLTWEEALLAKQRYSRFAGGRLYIDWFPSGAASVAAIQDRVQRIYDRTGWKPDVALWDYMDIFGPEPGHKGSEFRHLEDARWKAGRRFSQHWQCCLIVPTQANRPVKNRRVLTRKDISEDKRKYAHTTAFYGINRDDDDRRMGWMRVNPIVIREGGMTFEQVAVMQCLERGAPNLGSFRWSRKREGVKGGKKGEVDEAGGE